MTDLGLRDGDLLLKKVSPKPDFTWYRTGLFGFLDFYRTAVIFKRGRFLFSDGT